MRGPNKTHKVRRLVTSNKTGDVYGVTIPAVYVEECNLLGKKFEIELTGNGEFIMHTKFKEKKKC